MKFHTCSSLACFWELMADPDSAAVSLDGGSPLLDMSLQSLPDGRWDRVSGGASSTDSPCVVAPSDAGSAFSDMSLLFVPDGSSCC